MTQESRRSRHTLRSPVLNLLLQLAPVDPSAELRVLELDTDPEHGASAAELAARAGGSVVSMSQSTRITGAARAAHQHDNRLKFHSGRLTAGWPARAPYDLTAPRGAVMYPPCSGERLEEMSLDLMASPGLERERGT